MSKEYSFFIKFYRSDIHFEIRCMHLKTAHIPQGKHAALSEAVEGIHVATVLQGKSADIGVGQKAQQESLRFYFIIL